MNLELNKECLFCKIIRGEIPSKKVYEDDLVYAFNDIKPLAKIHVLFVLKDHTKDVFEMTNKNSTHIANIFNAISSFVKNNNLSESSFRVFTNRGEAAGQTVFHTHFHFVSSDI